MKEKVELFYEHNCKVAESPLWDEKKQKLYFVDILDQCFYIVDYETKKTEKAEFLQQIGCLALCENGELLLAMEDGIYRYKKDGTLKPEHEKIQIKGRRFNDGKVGPDGCYYVGTTDDYDEGAFYCLENGKMKELFNKCCCSNGIAWSLDGKKMYYCDSRKYGIEQFVFSNEKHDVSHRKKIFSIPKEFGLGDGMTIDANGDLWIAIWDGSCVLKIRPSTGEVLERIELPVRKVSSCTFGGKDMKDLFITTASVGSTLEKEPYAGSIFKVRCDVPGVPANRYRREK